MRCYFDDDFDVDVIVDVDVNPEVAFSRWRWKLAKILRFSEDQFTYKMLIEFKHSVPSLTKNLSITSNASPVFHFDK